MGADSVVQLGMGENQNDGEKFAELQNENASLRNEIENLKQIIEQKDEKIIELEIKINESPKEATGKDVASIIKNFDFDI